MEQENAYFLRLLARLLDLSLILLFLMIAEKITGYESTIPLAWFLLYNLLAVTLTGQSMGKYAFRLKVTAKHERRGHPFRMIARELLFLPLIPFLFINAVCSAPIALHDRISGTRVVRNEG